MPGKIHIAPWSVWVLLWLPAFFYPTESAGQRLHFKHFTVENGLASSNALTITQDDKGFLWIGTNDGLSRYDGSGVKVFRDFYKDNPAGANLKILSLVFDQNRQLWIGTNNGLYLYNSLKGTFTAFFHSVDKQSICHNVINRVFKDRQGGIWLCTQGGLCKVIAQGSSYRFMPIPLGGDPNGREEDVIAVAEADNGMMLAGTQTGLVVFSNPDSLGVAKSTRRILSGMRVISLERDRQNNFWAGTEGQGVIRMAPDFKVIKHYREDDAKGSILGNVAWRIYADRSGRVWIGTSKGLNIFYPREERFVAMVNDPEDQHSLNSNFILDIFEDRRGSVWLATYFGGLNYVDAVETPFQAHRSQMHRKGISGSIVSAIVEDGRGNLWIGNDGEGVSYYDRDKNVFKNYRDQMPFFRSMESNRLTSLLLDKTGHLWEGLFGEGVNVFDANGRKWKEFGRSGENRINSVNVLCLMQDHLDRVWIGTQVGINIYDSKEGTQKFEAVYPGKQVSDKEVSCLFEDSKKNIWIGTRQGLNVLRSSDNRLMSFNRTKSADYLPSDYVNCIAEDAKGVIWVGTYAGLSSYDPGKNEFRTYTAKDGLSGNKVVGIVADDRNNLWVSTDNGISRLDTARRKFNAFDIHDGLPGNVFYYRSFFKDSRGHIYFGSYNGLVEFVPGDIAMNKHAPEIVLTGLRIDGKEVMPNNSSGILSKSISETDELTLEYDQNVFTIDYAVMNFIKPQKNRSAYMLVGYDKKWVSADGHRATFTNIPEGDYTLLIKAANNDGYWGNSPFLLKLTILPPPWKTWWAYSLYVLAFSLLIAGVAYFFAARAAFRRKLRYVEMVNQKQQELHQMKMDFFTHISHEIRTPLTLIFLPLETLMDTFESDGRAMKMLAKIKVNAERLLTLTTDLLDFRKADSGYTQLKVSEANIVAFAEMVFEKFSAVAARKSIKYQFKSEQQYIPVYFDPHQLEIVLSNLLSNAFKFTLDKGRISVTLGMGANETIEIRVRDNGIGIPKESQDQIFNSFYQANAGGIKNTGAGIGLAFSKSLVELHKGKLSFQSGIDPGSGRQETEFMIILRLGKDHFAESFVTIG